MASVREKSTVEAKELNIQPAEALPGLVDDIMVTGRPKKQFDAEIRRKIEEYALNNCHLDTIALALDISKTTLVRRFGTIIKKKRAEGRINLRANQTKLSKHNPAMAIFLGKNELNQVDKQEILQTTDKPKSLSADDIRELQGYAERVMKMRGN
ncbi:MAG: hypothetical protein ACUZ9M_00865 [Candidatus Scalindua sp.]